MSEKQVKDYDKFVLRLPEGMRDAIAERAKANGRSMNSEITQIIEDALNTEVISWNESLAPKPDEEKVTMSMKQLNRIISTAAEDVAKNIVSNLTDKYDLSPKQKTN